MIKNIKRIIYSFGSQTDGFFSHLVLRDNGKIHGYTINNPLDDEPAHRWEISGDVLKLLTKSGRTKSLLKYCQTSQSWFGFAYGSVVPQYLLPALDMNTATPSAPDAPNVIVNTIPKAGTYFMNAALENAGCTWLRVHAIDFGLFDLSETAWKQAPSQEWLSSVPHVDANTFRYLLRIPPYVAAGVMHGNHIVCHLAEAQTLRALDVPGFFTVHIVRNLRAVLRSLFQFKKDRIGPVSAGDTLWRGLEGGSQFAAFLSFFYERDIKNIIDIAQTIIDLKPPIVLRYEDMYRGDISPLLSQLPKNSFSKRLAHSIKSVRDRPSGTLNHNRHSLDELWSDSAEQFFRQSGLSNLNKQLGYE